MKNSKDTSEKVESLFKLPKRFSIKAEKNMIYLSTKLNPDNFDKDMSHCQDLVEKFADLIGYSFSGDGVWLAGFTYDATLTRKGK